MIIFFCKNKDIGQVKKNLYCQAPVWIKFRKSQYPLLPAITLGYVGAIFLCSLIGLWVTEYYLARLETQGEIKTESWIREHRNINAMNWKKIQFPGKVPIWNSKGAPYFPKKKAAKRILIVGDSFVWGDGYANMNDIWWRQLQRELNHRGYWQVEVMAVGKCGASTNDQLKWLRDFKLIVNAKPDMVIVGYVTNDPDMQMVKRRTLSSQQQAEMRLDWLDNTLGKMAPKLNHLVQSRFLDKKLYNTPENVGYPYHIWELKLLEGKSFQHYQQIVAELAVFLKKQSLPHFVVTLPVKPDREYYQYRYQKIKPVFIKNGMAFYDLLDHFCREYLPGLNELTWGINPATGHPAAITTYFYARQVVDILERDYPQILGTKSSPLKLLPKINDWMPPSLSLKQKKWNQWQLNYPICHKLLYLPIRQDHIVLSFELPVAIDKIRISGDGLAAAEVFVSIIGASGYDSGKLFSLGKKNGAHLLWNNTLKSKKINSLRIAAQIESAKIAKTVIRENLAPGIASKQGKYGYFYLDLPEYARQSDSMSNLFRSPLGLLEDGKPLGPAHSSYIEIANQGYGRWLHWEKLIFFSTSDNTDPRHNQRKYTLVAGKACAKLIMTIDFNKKAVLP